MSDPSVDDLKKLCEMRLEDAFVLMRSQRHSAAYYLSGYAVECGFKAVIGSWAIVSAWRESSRYEIIDGNLAARMMISVADPNGVLPWLKQYW